MDLDKDDLAVLCRDMTKEEVDRIHRFLHEWGIGPEDSFPVQFVLLTRAQLRAAASIPRAIADNQPSKCQRFRGSENSDPNSFKKNPGRCCRHIQQSHCGNSQERGKLCASKKNSRIGTWLG